MMTLKSNMTPFLIINWFFIISYMEKFWCITINGLNSPKTTKLKFFHIYKSKEGYNSLLINHTIYLSHNQEYLIFNSFDSFEFITRINFLISSFNNLSFTKIVIWRFHFIRYQNDFSSINLTLNRFWISCGICRLWYVPGILFISVLCDSPRLWTIRHPNFIIQKYLSISEDLDFVELNTGLIVKNLLYLVALDSSPLFAFIAWKVEATFCAQFNSWLL